MSISSHQTTRKSPPCIALLLLLLPSLCFSAVFGDGDPANGIEDSRTDAPAQLLKAVGTVFCDGGLRGTASLVGPGPTADRHSPSIIITAAHVLFDTHTGLPFADCSYRPQNRRLKSVAFAEISQHAYQPLAEDRMRQSETDIVFVALQHRLHQKPLLLALPNRLSPKQLLAYNPNNERINISGQCQSYSSDSFVSEHLLLHNCDAESGSSGGPLLEKVHSEENPRSVNRVVAIHGGTLSNLGNSAPGSRVQPERWINQARKIDDSLLQRLEDFIAYLGRDSAD
ncbi:hypothetical protein N9X86_01185 [Porticoccaceae bacterium]|nr:hypothetical protein [Porticoccaceae bacterium]